MGIDRLDRISSGVPGFGQRSINLQDSNSIAVRFGYRVEEIEFETLYGLMLRTDRKTYLYLNSLSDTAERTVSLLHELYHALAEPDTLRAARTDVHNEEEWEAEAFALGAYIPRHDAERLSVRELVETYKVRKKLAKLRKLALKNLDI